MKKPPEGWPRLSAAVFYDDANAAITWLERAFAFATKIKIDTPDGDVAHSELLYGEALIMVGSTKGGHGAEGQRSWRKSPRAIDGANTQSLMLFVDDADAHCAHARANGAKILSEPTTTDYGDDYWTDRGYEAEDVEGHHWWFVERISGAKRDG